MDAKSGQEALKANLQTVLSATHGPNAKLHGASASEVRAAERRVGVEFPAPLREFYLVAGKTPALAEVLWGLDQVVFNDQSFEFVLGRAGNWVIKLGDLANDSVVFQTTAWELVTNAPHAAKGHFDLAAGAEPLKFLYPDPETRPQQVGPQGRYRVFIARDGNAAMVSYLRGINVIGASTREAVADFARSTKKKFKTLRPVEAQEATQKARGKGTSEASHLIPALVRVAKVVGSKVDLERAESIRGSTAGAVLVPAVLRSFYALCGQQEVFMSSYYRFIPFELLAPSGEYLPFCSDERAAVEWGVLGNGADDGEPEVHLRETNGNKWRATNSSLSRFLLHHACWQAVMSMKEKARATIAEKGPKRTALEKLLPRLAWYRERGQSESLINDRRRILASVIGGNELYVGARSTTELKRLGEQLGLELEAL